MDRQMIYDIVRDHLMTQNGKSINQGFWIQCRYRGEGGRMCAIGCLIPDEKYDESLEGDGVESRAVMEAIGIENTTENRHFLYDLQSIHDDHDVRKWPGALYHFAELYGLRP